MAFRPFATAARKTLKIGLIPADGIGREVIPVSVNQLSNVHFLFNLIANAFALYRPHAEHLKLWDLTSPSSSSMTCWLGLICSQRRELPCLERPSSKCDPDGRPCQ